MGSSPASAGQPRLGMLASAMRDPSIVLPIVLLLAFIARGAWLDQPPGGLIFDEAYYVNAARVLLGLAVEAGANYAGSPPGLDPNVEHPPLGKLLMAGSMAVFGDNGLGWRLPSIVAGLVVLATLYGIVRATGETAWLAILAVGLLAFDNLTLVHSRIGTLDILVLAPSLLGAWLVLRRRWLLAGAALGVALLVKLTALYALAAIIGFLLIEVLWTSQPDRGREAKRAALGLGIAGIVVVVVALGGLWLLDLRYTTFGSPFDHIAHMVAYGASLTEPIDHSGICVGATSAPWQWPFNECQINYFRVDQNFTATDGEVSRYATVDFRGALNPVLPAAMLLATLFGAWLAWTKRSRTAAWALVWAGANFLPFVVLALAAGRVTYLYYFLPVVPAAATLVAVLLLRSGLPRPVRWGYLVAYAVGFAAYFPFRQIP